ncbi:TAP-like protein-domain-containing protein [Flammula alnicola]|nr:TAP-like protein-domain-containing protein [Flammula alnicola]
MSRRILFGLFGLFILLGLNLLLGLVYSSLELNSWFVPDPSPLERATEFSWERLPPRKELEWRDCFQGRQCARLIVPLNHSDPLGELEAVIALIRKPSIFPPDSDSYRGPILFNPGGPGGSGVDFIQGLRGDCLAQSLVLSSILWASIRVVLGVPPPRIVFQDGRRACDMGQGSSVANDSAEGVARTWAHQTARDMLSIVEAHGRYKLQYWGFSYGTVLGATFASLFPDKSSASSLMVLLTPMTKWSNNLVDAGKALESFFIGCAEAGPDGCDFWAPTPKDIRQNLTRLYDSVRSSPLPIKSRSTYGLLDYSGLRTVVFTALYSPYALFPLLARGLAELAAGNGTPIFERLSDPPFQCSCDPSEHMFDVHRDASTAIICNDNHEIPNNLEWTEKYFETMGKASPEFGDMWSTGLIACQGWPKFPKINFQGPFEANTSHPILLIGNTADPVTPLWGAHKMSRGFNGSVVLTQDSAGHCSVSGPSLCTQQNIRKYFLDGTLPEPDTVCNVTESPFPEASSGFDPAYEQFLLTMDSDDREMFAAVLELSKIPFVPHFPLLVYSPQG